MQIYYYLSIFHQLLVGKDHQHIMILYANKTVMYCTYSVATCLTHMIFHTDQRFYHTCSLLITPPPHRLTMSTTFPVPCCLTLSRGSSTGSLTHPTPSSTTTRTSTCPSMGAGQETTGPVDTIRYSDEIMLFPAPHQCTRIIYN